MREPRTSRTRSGVPERVPARRAQRSGERRRNRSAAWGPPAPASALRAGASPHALPSPVLRHHRRQERHIQTADHLAPVLEHKGRRGRYNVVLGMHPRPQPPVHPPLVLAAHRQVQQDRAAVGMHGHPFTGHQGQERHRTESAAGEPAGVVPSAGVAYAGPVVRRGRRLASVRAPRSVAKVHRPSPPPTTRARAALSAPRTGSVAPTGDLKNPRD